MIPNTSGRKMEFPINFPFPSPSSSIFSLSSCSASHFPPCSPFLPSSLLPPFLLSFSRVSLWYPCWFLTSDSIGLPALAFIFLCPQVPTVPAFSTLLYIQSIGASLLPFCLSLSLVSSNPNHPDRD